MAHIQKRCGDKSCRRSVPEGMRSCQECGSKAFAYVARFIDPQRREISRSFKRKTDAEAFLHSVETAKNRNEYVRLDRGRECLRDFFERWRAGTDAQNHLAPSTRDKYDTVFRLYLDPLVGRTELRRITRATVKSVVSRASNTSAWQAAEALKLLRLLLNYAVDEEEIQTNPAARVAAPEPRRTPPRILTPQEIASIVRVLPERWRAFVLLGAYGSLRWSELVAVKRDDFDLAGRTVRVDEKVVEVRGDFHWGRPKTAGSERTIDLPEFLLPALAEHMLRYPPLLQMADQRLDGLVFYGERRGIVRRHVFRKVWNRACMSAGIEGVRPEWLRHSGASLAYLATKDMKAVAARLGHTSTRMTDDVYVGVYAEASRGVADAIDELVRRSGALPPA